MKKYNALKDKKKLEFLIKVLQRIYEKNPGMEDVIDASVIEVCAEEAISPEQVIFILLFLCCYLYHNGYSRKISEQEC